MNVTEQNSLTVVFLLPPVEPPEHGIRQVHTDIWRRRGVRNDQHWNY